MRIQIRQVMHGPFENPKTWNQWEDLSNDVERADVEVYQCGCGSTPEPGTTEEGSMHHIQVTGPERMVFTRDLRSNWI